MKFLTILFLLSVLFISCSDELNPTFTSLENAAAGVTSKKIYALDITQMIGVEDYEYDYQKRLSKKSYYGGNREFLYYYEKYFYEQGKLKAKITYNRNINSPSGFITLDSTIFFYSGNLLSSEKTIYPLADTYDEVKYEYDGSRLKTKYFYSNGRYLRKKVYEYDNEYRLLKCTDYNSNEKLDFYNEYSYRNNFLVEDLHYASNNDLLTKTDYEYDNKGKLTKETLKVVSMYLSISSHVILYEYKMIL